MENNQGIKSFTECLERDGIELCAILDLFNKRYYNVIRGYSFSYPVENSKIVVKELPVDNGVGTIILHHIGNDMPLTIRLVQYMEGMRSIENTTQSFDKSVCQELFPNVQQS